MPEITSSSKRVKEVVRNPEIGMASTQTSKKNKPLLFYIGILVFLAITSIAVYSSYELRKIKNPAYQQEATQKKVKELVADVSKIMELPEETPQVATVSDVEVLKKTQPFFVKAQNGDEVLIYSNQAILYRPSIRKIVNVASVNKDPEPAKANVEADTSKKETAKETADTAQSDSKKTDTKNQ